MALGLGRISREETRRAAWVKTTIDAAAAIISEGSQSAFCPVCCLPRDSSLHLVLLLLILAFVLLIRPFTIMIS